MSTRDEAAIGTPAIRDLTSAARLARDVGRVARGLGRLSDLAAAITRVGLIITTAIALGALVANVFTRNALGMSIEGSEEVYRFAFLWVIWLGASLAVKRGAITQFTLFSHHGPAWWQRSVRTFSWASVAVLLAYACVRSTQYVNSGLVARQHSTLLEVPYVYPVASMTVGYYLISLHYLARAAGEAPALLALGRRAAWPVATAIVGALALATAVWLGMAGVLAVGGSWLVALGLIFVALTLAGTPIVFMLSIVGIIAFLPSFLGLEFYPVVDPLAPFRTTQGAMGLDHGGSLIVILAFLVTAGVMNASGMSERLITFAASLVGHLRGGMAYVAQLTSAVASGISGAATADAAIMTPLLVPAMEREGYRRDVAAAVVAGASIKGAIGPLSVMFIVYATLGTGATTNALLLSGLAAVILLLVFQMATVYVVVRRMDMLAKRRFAGWGTVGRTGVSAFPVLAIPVIILGGLFSGVFTATEAGGVAVAVALAIAMFGYANVSPRRLASVLTTAGIEVGVVMLLVGDSAILAHALYLDRFSESLAAFFTGITSDTYVFLLLVNVLLLLVGMFLEPLPALYILAWPLSHVAVNVYGMNPVHFGLIMVFSLVLALIHPPMGLVIFLVSSLAKVSIERLSIMILPWLAVSVLVLFLVTYLPTWMVLALANWLG